MENSLQLVKSQNFGNVQCDFYGDGKDNFYMTREQIGSALEYSDPMVAIGKLHDRHEERLDKFSFTSLVNGRQVYFYSAKGVYEICRWSQQEKANEFYDWVYELLESLRKGETKLLPMSEYQRLMLETRQKNANVREASMLFKISQQVEIPEYKQVLQAHVTKIITGEYLLPLPTAERKTYSAEDIGKMFSVTKQRIGIIANGNNLKVKEYGKLFYDKAQHSNKQVESWRYYDTVIPEFERILGVKVISRGMTA